MVNFSRSVLKILHRAEKIYTGGARDKYEVWVEVYEVLGVIWVIKVILVIEAIDHVL